MNFLNIIEYLKPLSSKILCNTTTLWADDANNIQNGDKIKIENGYTNEFKGEVQLGKGKFGKLEKI